MVKKVVKTRKINNSIQPMQLDHTLDRVRQIDRQIERERERGVREREKDEESMRMRKERKSPRKTDVPKLYNYNECELSVRSRVCYVYCWSVQ